MISVIVMLQAESVRLEEIFIRNLTDDAAVHKLLIRYLMQATSLAAIRYVTARPLGDMNFFRDILRLPRIRRLKLVFDDWRCSFWLEPSGCANLLIRAELPQLVQSLQLLPTMNIVSLSIRSASHPLDYLDHWKMCTQLAFSHGAAQVRQLSVVHNVESANGDPSPNVSFELVKMWFAFPNLEEFSFKVSFSGRCTPAEGDIQLLARAWPHLRVLSLDIGRKERLGPPCLVPLAQHCPSLQSLRVALGGDIPSLSDTPLLSHGLTSLTLINPDDQFGLNWFEFSEYLYRLFPRVVVEGIHDSNSLHDIKWLMEAFRRAVLTHDLRGKRDEKSAYLSYLLSVSKANTSSLSC